jgi:hypothetical protein
MTFSSEEKEVACIYGGSKEGRTCVYSKPRDAEWFIYRNRFKVLIPAHHLPQCQPLSNLYPIKLTLTDSGTLKLFNWNNRPSVDHYASLLCSKYRDFGD